MMWNKNRILLLLFIMGTIFSIAPQALVQKKILSNGLVVLVREVSNVQDVAVQLWYHVGSKDEKSGEKGLAHLLEHATFKGTGLMSESDMKTMAHKLSASYMNAFTSYDTTTYLFSLPGNYWKYILPLLADCMVNCTFPQDPLNAELQTVVQELREDNDKPALIVRQYLLSLLWPDHPYHYPVIGYKQDLWNITRDKVISFYKKHYIPNNAVLVVVGNVKAEEVFSCAQQAFGGITANLLYKKEKYSNVDDICQHTVTIYRDIQQPCGLIHFKVPGLSTGDRYSIEVLGKILLSGPGSRLFERLVEKEHLVSHLRGGALFLFDYDTVWLYFQPFDSKQIEKIITIINEEITKIAHEGLSAQELQQIMQEIKVGQYHLLNNNNLHAQAIARYYLARHDENYVYHYYHTDLDLLNNSIKALCEQYLRPSLMHTGFVMPFKDVSDKREWENIQKLSDEYDTAMIHSLPRTTPVQEPRYAPTVQVEAPHAIPVIQPDVRYLSNGVKVLSYHDESSPLVWITIDLKKNNQKQPHGMNFLRCAMMLRGTKQYDRAHLIQELCSHAMTLSIVNNRIYFEMLNTDGQKGLELLHEVVCCSTFPEEALPSLKESYVASQSNFYNNAESRAYDLIMHALYPDRPLFPDRQTLQEQVSGLTRDQVFKNYQERVTPDGAIIAVIGNIKQTNIMALLEEKFGTWQGPALQDVPEVPLVPVKAQEITHTMSSDQVVLYMAGHSITRLDPEWECAALCNGIFNNRLFNIREETGACYEINGTILSDCGHRPGKILVKAIVSPSRVQELQKHLEQMIDSVADTITQEELDAEKSRIILQCGNYYASLSDMADTFIFLDRFTLGWDYFAGRKERLDHITLEDVKRVVKKIVGSDKMVTVKVGRL